MRHILFAAAFAALCWPALAQQDAFKGVIGAQIEAFRADDFDTAFTFASPGIQGMFRTPDNFGRMVRQGYPMVWRPERVEYLGAQREGPGWRQEILVTDMEGRLHKLAYTMVETPEGWKIAGVQLLRAPEVGA
ncbi:DUF4864 domain-containing protein [Jannaschia seohaensis]|uniref:Uncharacterized protein DUF4864 n=1 Tax=Jannaschia seohaensis TaxID=475081 RepID=A0A2Y9B4W1_9RHOB|nr:DUF4864 domain-containing protein [Jannaschia seohaensis]PWJ16259.1 uncharacterized protein DUF4864 [Jannaschia seohaensis]SSA49339.1 protein of unknown function [Jannaschia seohaensis]